jgi:hypothetical protein
MISNIRIHDICRTERYYTATLLPYVLLHGAFAGLKSFLRMLERKSIRALSVQDKVPVPLNDAGDFTHVELISEMDIARDTQFYSPWLSGLEDISIEEADRLRPDLVLVVVEAKFFHDGAAVGPVRDQILAQKNVIEKILLRFPGYSFDCYCHLFLSAVPLATADAIGCQGVLSWEDMKELAEQVLGGEHYVTQRLVRAIEMYNLVHRKASRRGETGCNYRGRLGLREMIQRCQQEGDRIMVGYSGGAAKLRTAMAEELAARKFKWDSADHPVGAKISGNWLSGRMFLDLTAGKLADAGAFSAGHEHGVRHRSPSNYRGKLGAAEMVRKCQKEGNRILIGYQGGESRLKVTPSESLKMRTFKWDWADDPIPPKVPCNWLTGVRFLKLVTAKLPNL